MVQVDVVRVVVGYDWLVIVEGFVGVGKIMMLRVVIDDLRVYGGGVFGLVLIAKAVCVLETEIWMFVDMIVKFFYEYICIDCFFFDRYWLLVGVMLIVDEVGMIGIFMFY